MGDLLECHKAAMKEVMEALNMLRSRDGSTAKDIYFVLDNLHGRVQRHVIQHALKSAVSKGLLQFQNHRYKIRKQRKVGKRMSRRKSRPQRTRVAYVVTDGPCNHYDIPVRNFECRARSRRGKSSQSFSRSKSYSFREVNSLLACDCSTGSDVSTEQSYSRFNTRQKRIKAKKQVKRKYPLPKKIKVEKEEKPCKQNLKETELKVDGETDDTPPENQRSEFDTSKAESTKKSTNTGNKDDDTEKKSQKTGSKSTGSKNSDSSKNQDGTESVKTQVIDSTSTAEKSNTSQKSGDDKRIDKVETDSVGKDTCRAGSEVSRYSRRGCRKVRHEEEAHRANEECRYVTRSRAKRQAEKRRRPKSSNSSGSNHKRAKMSSKKSIKQEKRIITNDKDSGSSSQNYDHMYSRLSAERSLRK